jgi:cystathionine beta-synthase
MEGLLVGGSSGSCVWAAIEVGRRCRSGERVLAILPDSIRNYLTKFVDDRWMKDNNFLEPDWAIGTIGDVVRALPAKKILTADITDTVGRVVAILKRHGVSQLPVLDGSKLAGIVTETDVLTLLVEGRAHMENSVAEVMNRRVSTVTADDPAGRLHEFFNRGEVAIVLDDAKRVVALLTKIDFVEYLTKSKAFPAGPHEPRTGRGGVG